jgi:hypothetical protein
MILLSCLPLPLLVNSNLGIIPKPAKPEPRGRVDRDEKMRDERERFDEETWKRDQGSAALL